MSVSATIKWFDGKKGYGFAAPAEGGDDIFVHQDNIVKGEDGMRPFLYEDDTIYYEVGEHNGRPTAMTVTVPPDHVNKPPSRSRGRNANKAADAESDQLAKEDAADALKNALDEAPKPATTEQKEKGGGRDGKTRRRNDRTRRNDKGLGASKPKPGSASTRQDTKSDTKQAATDAN